MENSFNLYSSEGCHLCDLAFDICAKVIEDSTLQVVDIVNNPKLVDEYGIHIPVLENMNSGQKLYWPFDEAKVKDLVK